VNLTSLREGSLITEWEIITADSADVQVIEPANLKQKLKDKFEQDFEVQIERQDSDTYDSSTTPVEVYLSRTPSAVKLATPGTYQNGSGLEQQIILPLDMKTESQDVFVERVTAFKKTWARVGPVEPPGQTFSEAVIIILQTALGVTGAEINPAKVTKWLQKGDFNKQVLTKTQLQEIFAQIANLQPGELVGVKVNLTNPGGTSLNLAVLLQQT
jgi:hypothetical protein